MSRSAITAIFLLVSSARVASVTAAPEVAAGIRDAESLAMSWTVSPDPARRAFGLRMLATMASPRWAEARRRLMEDCAPEVRLALLDGIAWMGERDPAAVEHVLCELGEPSPVGDVWPSQTALFATPA